MTVLRLALLQSAGVLGDVGANLAELDAAAAEAAAAGAGLLMTPEMFLTGYELGAERTAEMADRAAGELVPAVAQVARRARDRAARRHARAGRRAGGQHRSPGRRRRRPARSPREDAPVRAGRARRLRARGPAGLAVRRRRREGRRPDLLRRGVPRGGARRRGGRGAPRGRADRADGAVLVRGRRRRPGPRLGEPGLRRLREPQRPRGGPGLRGPQQHRRADRSGARRGTTRRRHVQRAAAGRRRHVRGRGRPARQPLPADRRLDLHPGPVAAGGGGAA